MKKFYFLIIGVLLMNAGLLNAQNTTYSFEEISILDSALDYMSLGTKAFHEGSDGNLHAFYAKRGGTDTIWHVMSTDNGTSWTGKEWVGLNPQGGNGNQYHVNWVSATEDDNGKWHVVFTWRGSPYYDASSSYPPSHVGYATNESGSWMHTVNAIDDSLVQATQQNMVPTCYVYSTYLYNQAGLQYFSAYDYAWFSNKYNFLWSARDTATGVWPQATALKTIDRGAIDKYSMSATRIFGNGSNKLYAMWYNLFDGKLRIAGDSAGTFDSGTVVAEMNNPKDGTQHHEGVSLYSGATTRVSFSRWLTGHNNTTICHLKNDGSGWVSDTTQIPGTHYYPQMMLRSDTVITMTLRNTYDKFFITEQNSNGFVIDSVDAPDSLQYIFIDAIEGSNKVIYVKRDLASGWYWIGYGQLNFPDIVIGNDEEFAGVEFELFPNPSEGKAELSLGTEKYTGGLSIRITDLQGREISSMDWNPVKERSIELSNKGEEFDPGVYLVKIENKTTGLTKTKRMLILR